MRGSDTIADLLSYVDLEKRIRPGHPLRVIREIVNAALGRCRRSQHALRAGWPVSIPPERLCAHAVQAFFSIRSERQLVERIESICCSAGSWPGVDDPVWSHDLHQKPRSPARGDVAVKFLATGWRILASRRCSPPSILVDGTLLEASASTKSFRPNDGSAAAGWRTQRRAGLPRPEAQQRDAASVTDPDARLYRKGAARRPSSASGQR